MQTLSNNEVKKNSSDHPVLQTVEPTDDFGLWIIQLIEITAKEVGISEQRAATMINTKEAYEWWKDGFTPYVTFRENY